MVTARKDVAPEVMPERNAKDVGGTSRENFRSRDIPAPVPELLEVTDRQQLLAYTKDMLVGLAVCTQKHDLNFLSYLLGMAVIEANEQLGKTKTENSQGPACR